MSKGSRQHRPNHNTETMIVLSKRDFQDFYGLCAIAALNVQAIQKQAAQAIAAAQQPRQKALTALVKKYRSHGMRLDVDYRFDESTHSLVVVTS